MAAGAARGRLRVVAAAQDDADDGAAVLRLIAEREAQARLLADLDARIAEACRRYSYARGYRVPLRPEQVRREVHHG